MYITGIRTSEPPQFEHITHVRWQQPSTGKTGILDVPAMIQWMRTNPAVPVRTWQAGREAAVQIVETRPPHLRTYANGVSCDNLLNLPRV